MPFGWCLCALFIELSSTSPEVRYHWARLSTPPCDHHHIYINMASIQPVFGKIFEVKIGGSHTLIHHYLHVKHKIFICSIIRNLNY